MKEALTLWWDWMDENQIRHREVYDADLQDKILNDFIDTITP